jgi:hypothetical protein
MAIDQAGQRVLVRAGGQTKVPWLYFPAPITCWGSVWTEFLGMENDVFWKRPWKPWKASAGRG